jgi:hypothetical protein
MNRQHVAVVALVALITLAGCADGAVTTTVDSEGEVEQIQMEAEMSQEAYALALEEAGEEGHDSVSGAIAANIDDEMGDVMTDAEYEDQRGDGVVILDITFNEVDIEKWGGMETEQTDEDTIRYTDNDFQNATMDEVDSMTYQVEMPGEIIETNADEVDEENNVAVWDVHNTDVETAHVESEQDSFSLWTVAAAVGIGAIVLIGGLLAYRRFGEADGTLEDQ